MLESVVKKNDEALLLKIKARKTCQNGAHLLLLQDSTASLLLLP